jgi:hypothetical protein
MNFGSLTIISSHGECKYEALTRHALELGMREAAIALGSAELLLDDFAPAPASRPSPDVWWYVYQGLRASPFAEHGVHAHGPQIGPLALSGARRKG